MTVKEIFELRRQGKIEEAYDAIRPLYAAHKGRYTSLCMFWTAADIFKKRLDEGRTDEATKIFEALKRVLPYIKDHDTRPDGTAQPAAGAKPDDGIPVLGIDKPERSSSDSAAAFIQSASRRLSAVRKLEQLEASRQEKQLRSSEPLSALSALSAGQDKEEPQGSIRGFREIRVTKEEALPQGEPLSAVSALSAGQEEDSSNSSASCSKEEDLPQGEPISAVSVSQEKEYLSGHLAVSLDEGIIRPIEGLNAIQRVVLACVVGHPGYSVPRISESTGIPQNSIERYVAVLIDRGLIEPRKGEMNSAEYYQIK